MNHRYLLYSLLFLINSLMSCSGIDESQQTEKKGDYYDLSGLVQSQMETLNDQQPKVYKTAEIDGQEESKLVENVDWEKELSLFVDADLNKPRLISLYDTRNYKNDEGDQVIVYQMKEKDVSGVIKMEIVNDPTEGELKKILIEYCEANLLFTTEQWLSLDFNGSSGTPELKSYSIEGFEKMVMKDTMSYKIHGEIK